MKPPRLHPNGFLQFDLDDNTRLNVWDKTLPKAQTINTPIHDHTFDFTSRVIAGTLIHIAYGLTIHADGQYELWGVTPWSDGEDTVLKPLPGMRGDLYEVEKLTLPAGNSYQFRAGWFHETQFDGFTATIMTKTRKNVTPAARVVVPVGSGVDNDFSRYSPPMNDLYQYVRYASTFLRGPDLDLFVQTTAGDPNAHV